nr:A9 [uncultured bacterium]
MVSEAIAKIKKPGQDLAFLLLAICFLVLAIAQSQLVPASYRPALPDAAPRFLRPPLRGPPLPISR